MNSVPAMSSRSGFQLFGRDPNGSHVGCFTGQVRESARTMPSDTGSISGAVAAFDSCSAVTAGCKVTGLTRVEFGVCSKVPSLQASTPYSFKSDCVMVHQATMRARME